MKSLKNISMDMYESYGVVPKLIKLKNGQIAMLRTVRPEDAIKIKEMHDRLSLASLYFRYLYAYKPRLEDMQRLSQQDDCSGAAFVAILQDGLETIIGLSNYRVNPRQPDVAEPAVIVDDHFQRQGLGSALLERLRLHAAARGIRAFQAFILPSNNRIRRLIAHSSLAYDSKYNWEQGVLEVILPLAASVPATSALNIRTCPETIPGSWCCQ